MNRSTRLMLGAGGVVGLLLAATASFRCLNAQSSPPPPRPVSRIYVDLVKLSLDSYVENSSLIALATAQSSTPVVPSDGVAYTLWHFTVNAVAKGNWPASIDVRVAGADTPDRLVLCPGAPTFAIGEQVLLFLFPVAGSTDYGILGLGDGTYRISLESGTPGGDPSNLHVLGMHAPNVPLDDFIDQIIAIASSQGN